jgi:hypothetical protein
MWQVIRQVARKVCGRPNEVEPIPYQGNSEQCKDKNWHFKDHRISVPRGMWKGRRRKLGTFPAKGITTQKIVI